MSTTSKKISTSPVCVRANLSGTWVARSLRRDGDRIHLTDAIRLYLWRGATLSQIGQDGITPDDDGNRVCVTVPDVSILASDAVEIHAMPVAAYDRVASAPRWRI